jgi:hypothetical protein
MTFVLRAETEEVALVDPPFGVDRGAEGDQVFLRRVVADFQTSRSN